MYNIKKHKTSSIPIKSSGMSQLLSYNRHTIHVYVWCVCGVVVASLNPQQSPTPPVCHPSPILPLHSLTSEIWRRQNYQKKSNWSYIRLLYLQKFDNNINFIIYLLLSSDKKYKF